MIEQWNEAGLPYSCEPRALPGDAIRCNPHDVTGRRIGHWRKTCARSDVHLRQPLQQLGSAIFGNSRSTMHDQIVTHANSIRAWRLERNSDAGIASYIPQLLLRAAQMRSNQFVTFNTNPDNGDLWAAISINGDQMSQRTTLDQSARAVRQLYRH
jgi:hypothetical protein